MKDSELSHIIKGYNGIMDLDLTNIPVQFHRELVQLHVQEIEEYKVDQLSRPERMRYENTINRAEAYEEKCRKLLSEREKRKEEEWIKMHAQRCDAIKRYNSIK